MAKFSEPEQAIIGSELAIPRMISGLWQLAGGHDEKVDIGEAAEAMNPLIDAGLECFDMADHYGDAELVIGRHNSTSTRRITSFTKWCPPESGVTSFENAEAALDRALKRMGQSQIALMQYHVWSYSDPTYLHNMSHLRTLQQQGKIRFIGLTNTDSAHLELLLNSGFKIVTNQISCSVIDRRLTRGRMSSICEKHDVGILAYGTLLGGYLTEKWLDQPEPQNPESMNWSLRKYLRFINAAGGWTAFQTVLKALSQVSNKHNVPIAAVATRHVLDIPTVKAVIVGSRLSKASEKHTASNLLAFSFKLDEEDKALISKAQESLTDISGESGDEYRRSPFLTATGDLSQHLKQSQQSMDIEKAIQNGSRVEYSSDSTWESIAGYCRGVRTGNTIRISGTTANSPIPHIKVVGGSSARSQTVAILDIISQAIQKLGGKEDGIVQTRIVVQNESDVEEVSRAHGWAMKCLGIKPANTLVVAGIIGDEYLVEIEAEAVVGGNGSVLRI